MLVIDVMCYFRIQWVFDWTMLFFVLVVVFMSFTILEGMNVIYSGKQNDHRLPGNWRLLITALLSGMR